MTPSHDVVVTSVEIDEVVRALAAMPGYFESLARGLDDARLRLRPGEDAWSANDVLAHLRACADVWGKSIVAMIERDRPTLRYVSPRTWIRKTSYAEQPFDQSLQAYTVQRDDLVRALKALAVGDWSRGATFTGTTRGREQTILSYARRIVDHEREHGAQIEATLA
jgi:hypothetical protein